MATIYKGFKQGVSLEDLRERLRKFAEDRDWNQFHTPRNVLLALVGEVGELSEIFQWRGEVRPGIPEFKDEEKVHLGEELSDVLLYLIRLADRCNIDLAQAALKKLEKNAKKYPADLSKGKSDKYTAYNKEENKADGNEARATLKAEAPNTIKTAHTSYGQLLVVAFAAFIYVVIYLAVEH
uniref:Uncharacterized protein n=1 Tax=Lotharella globosa TaxID=91324 RepID=A0A7S3ZA40_9EUKA